MASIAPVCSPTAIICVTMPGNTSASFKGSVSDLPSSSDFLTCCKAFSTTALPAVLAVMSRPSRMGTPLEISVPSVRVKRATPIFLIRMPTIGSFRTMVSSMNRPCRVPYQIFKPKSAPTMATRKRRPKMLPTKLLMAMTIFAGSDTYHAHWIDESGLDGALQFDVLFDVRRKALQNGIQNTARLTGLDHVDVQGIEDLWRAAHCRREGRAAFDLTARSGQDLLKDLVLLLARQNLKTLYKRQTGIDHDRALSREDRELLGLHAATESGHAEFLALFGHFRGGDLLPLQQARQLSLVGSGHYSADAGALAAGSLVFIVRHLIASS